VLLHGASRTWACPEVCGRGRGRRLPAVVDLPTPPFPEATAMMCFTPSGLRRWGAPEGAPPLPAAECEGAAANPLRAALGAPPGCP